MKCLFDGAVEDRQSQINMHCVQRFRPIALKRTFNRRLGCSQEKISCLDAVLSQGRTSSRSSTTAAPEAKKNKRPALSIPPGRAEPSQPTLQISGKAAVAFSLTDAVCGRDHGPERHHLAAANVGIFASRARVSATTRSWKFGSRTSAEPCIGWPPSS